MGEHDIQKDKSEDQQRAFMKALLADVHALEKMLEEGLIESGIRRIGAEQEMFLVDQKLFPAKAATHVLDRINDPRLATELAMFNLEANLTPRVFGGSCLSDFENEMKELLAKLRKEASALGLELLLTGILPTLTKAHLGLDYMTPSPRYAELNESLSALRGGEFQIHIKGLDELLITHDNVMLEACNTSFQIHFQTGPDEFPRLYNLAQAITAPVLAAAVNSPLLLGKKLWQETRVALFQHSVDDRSTSQQVRGHQPRVRFGEDWIHDSVLEIFREDIARFRIVLTKELDEDPMKVLERGELPLLSALRLHNGTVWRWNRACYGVHEGHAHLRIENRALPSGPTLQDEIANSAFFFGLMSSLADEYPDITQVLDFGDVKNNFFAAARHGLNAQFTWVGKKVLTARDLILGQLLPMALAGLKKAKIDSSDIDRYLGIVEERVRSERTGAKWMLDSLDKMGKEGTPDLRLRTLTSAMLLRQKEGKPVHEWTLADLDETTDWRHSYRTVGQFMTTDIFSVRPDDLVDLAASLMSWKYIRHVPVEDEDGKLVGLISYRDIIPLVAKKQEAPLTARQIMHKAPVTATPETPTLEAIAIMRNHKCGCLPILDENKRLVGIVTAQDFLLFAAKLLEEHLKEP